MSGYRTREIGAAAQELVAVVEELSGEPEIQIAALRAAAGIINEAVMARALVVAMANALKPK